MKNFIILVVFFSASCSFAQNDTIKGPWIPKGVVSLNLSQIALDNWTQGGEDALAFNLIGDFGVKYVKTVWALDNNLKISYGRTKLGSDDFRTTDNELYLENVLSYQLGWVVNPYFSNTVRTVVAKGYNYTDTGAVAIANFFDPGYITQSIGFTYNRTDNFSTRLGFAFQETFTRDYTSYSDDPETPDEVETFKFETGIESVTEGSYTLDENMLLQSKLRLFTRFDAMDVWDVRWDNTITAKVNSYINVNLNVLIIYERSQSVKTQIKEALQLGFTYSLF